MSALSLPGTPPTEFSGHEAWVRAICDDLEYRIFEARIWLIVERDKTDPEGRLYLQVACDRPDTFTGLVGEGRGGKAYLSQHMMKDEIVQLAWGLFDAYVHHEAREGFFYCGRRIYGPHQKVDNLWAIAEDIVTR